jgi:hypothetical protein
MLRLTLDIFSGRPNPTVIVAGLEEKELLARLRVGPKSGSRSTAPPLPPSTLGYRGIIVEQLGAAPRGRAPERLRIAGGFVYAGRGGLPTLDPFVDDFVCGSTGPFRRAGLDDRFFDRCPEELDRFRVVVRLYPWRRWPWPLRGNCNCAPLYEPAWWNDNGQRQWNNNCYNYGTNYRSDTFAQPGLANNAMYNTISCADVRAGAIADALINSPTANNRCPKEGHLVALVVGPNWDFHWYRKGRNGRWTHKPGGTEVTNVDNSGNIITDPRTADRGGYTNFCSFMTVMHGHVKIM